MKVALSKVKFVVNVDLFALIFTQEAVTFRRLGFCLANKYKMI